MDATRENVGAFVLWTPYAHNGTPLTKDELAFFAKHADKIERLCYLTMSICGALLGEKIACMGIVGFGFTASVFHGGQFPFDIPMDDPMGRAARYFLPDLDPH